MSPKVAVGLVVPTFVFISGKKYYLLNLDEEERCALAINRLLRVGPESGAEVEGEASAEADAGETEVEDEVDVNVDVEA